MSVLNGLRRMFGKPRVVEIDASVQDATAPTVSDALLDDRADASVEAIDDVVDPLTPPDPPRRDAHEMLSGIETLLTTGRDAQERAIAALEGLPRPLAELERLGAGQDELVRLLRAVESGLERRADADRDFQTSFTDLLEREHALFGLIQRQLDANHEAAGLTASRLDDLATAVRDTAQTNQRTASALAAVVEELRAQEKRHDERAGIVQGWIITCVVACIGATAAALALAWAVMQARG